MSYGRSIGSVLAAVVAAVLTAAPAAADVAWPDGVGPDVYRAATVGPASITAGRDHSCAVVSTGDVYCWGSDSAGQLGDDRAGSVSPVAVAVAGGLIGIAVQVDAGDAHTCALDHDGLAYCWGDNSDGRLGDGGGPDRALPVRVEALADRTLVEITAGARHSCAIDDVGAAWCWGDNGAGQLGVPGLPASAVPVRVSTGSGLTDPVVDISAGGGTTCAATAEGVAWCWGDGADGRLGDGASTGRDAPARVAGSVVVRQVAVGGTRSCAVDSAGAVSCWGAGTASPVAVPAPGVRFTEVAAGGGHVCGLDRGAAVRCWGAGTDGQLGDGSTADAPDPVAVGVAGAVRDLDAGDRHSCALARDGYAYCWGADDAGQLGNGPGGASAVPVQVRGLPRPPGTVTRLTVTATDGGLRVRWRPATGFGSGDFTRYLALTSRFESSCEVTDPEGTGCDLTGLRNGTAYDVAVLTVTTDGTALSDFGTGTPTAPAVVIPPDPVDPPAPDKGGGGGGGLPVTGPAPPLAAAGFLLVGLGLAALLVRKP